jgi:hypothetical protein
MIAPARDTLQHFAGLNTASFAAALEGRPVLVSYADVIERPGVWAREILPRLEAGAYSSVILDSGAFSELTRPDFHVDLDAYGAFALEHAELFDLVVNLDDIGGDLERTWRNQAALEALGLDVLPVYHGREPWCVLEHYAARYDYVGLGFARDRGRIAKDQGQGLDPEAWLAAAFALIGDRAEVHGFGMTRHAEAFPFTTTDSTTWIAELCAIRRDATVDELDPAWDAGDYWRSTAGVGSWFAGVLEELTRDQLAELVLASYDARGGDPDPDVLECCHWQARTVFARFDAAELEAWLEAELPGPDPSSCEISHNSRDAAACPFCGEEAGGVELLEVWREDRAFQISGCCEASEALWREEMETWDRKAWAAWFASEAGLQVRQVCGPGPTSGATLDWGLRLGEVEQRDAKGFVRDHHRHNRPPAGWRWGHGVYNGDELVAVAMIGRPVARALDPAEVVEVNRVCVRPDLVEGLVWNACSMLYAAAAREAKRRGFSRIITYTLESEAGTTLRAAGWEPVATTRGGSWDRPSRPRDDRSPTCPKIRWERQLRAERAQAAA